MFPASARFPCGHCATTAFPALKTSCCSMHAIADRNALRARDEIGFGEFRRTVELHAFEPGQQFLPEEAHLEPRQMLAETDMRAIAEGELFVRRTLDVEAEGS